jgi:hypothetical protein
MASTEPGSDKSAEGLSCAWDNREKQKVKTKIKVRVIRPPVRDGHPKAGPKVWEFYYGKSSCESKSGIV